MLKLFTLKYEERTVFNDSVLSTFLADKEILRWVSHFFERKNEFFWTVLVEYRSTSQTEPVRKTEKRIDESYKELLTENECLSSTYCGNGGKSGAKKREYHLTLSVITPSLPK